jgi:hypothetical protein
MTRCKAATLPPDPEETAQPDAPSAGPEALPWRYLDRGTVQRDHGGTIEMRLDLACVVPDAQILAPLRHDAQQAAYSDMAGALEMRAAGCETFQRYRSILDQVAQLHLAGALDAAALAELDGKRTRLTLEAGAGLPKALAAVDAERSVLLARQEERQRELVATAGALRQARKDAEVEVQRTAEAVRADLARQAQTDVVQRQEQIAALVGPYLPDLYRAHIRARQLAVLARPGFALWPETRTVLGPMPELPPEPVPAPGTAAQPQRPRQAGSLDVAAWPAGMPAAASMQHSQIGG